MCQNQDQPYISACVLCDSMLLPGAFSIVPDMQFGQWFSNISRVSLMSGCAHMHVLVVTVVEVSCVKGEEECVTV